MNNCKLRIDDDTDVSITNARAKVCWESNLITAVRHVEAHV